MSRYTASLMEVIQSELQNKGHNEFVNNGNLSFNNSEFAFIQKVLRFDDDVKKIVDNSFFKGFKFNDERIDRYFKEAFVTRFLDREINRQTVEAFASQVLYVTLTREDYIFTVFGSEMQKYLEQHTETISEDRGKALENATEQGQTKQRQQQKTHDEYESEDHETHSDESHETTDNTEHADGNKTSDNRQADATLPQSEVNVNVDNTVLDYADNNTISRNKDVSSDDKKSNGVTDSESSSKSDRNGRGSSDGDLDSITNGENDTKRNTQQENTSNHEALNKTYLIDNLKEIESMREKIFEAYDRKCFLHIW